MTEETLKRKLAAILSADVVGYSSRRIVDVSHQRGHGVTEIQRITHSEIRGIYRQSFKTTFA